MSPLLSRHDLPSSSPVHETVALVNNFISELCCRQEGVELLDVSGLIRQHFARQGLHLNGAGKDVMVGLIVKGLSQLSAPPRRQPAVGRATTPPDLTSPPPRTNTPNKTLQHETYRGNCCQRSCASSSDTSFITRGRQFFPLKTDDIFRDSTFSFSKN